MEILPHEKSIYEYEETIKQVEEQNKNNGLWTKDEIEKLKSKLKKLKQKIYSNLSVWDRVLISRHASRPHTIDYLKNIADEYEEIYGDRTLMNDPSIITALAKIDGKKFVIIGHEKGNDTDSRIYRNFGMTHPEGFRKALRAMKLAEKFNIPVVTFLDTPGAYPGLSAEERGQGAVIAKNLFEMSKLKTPIIVVLIGEGCSGGALGIGVGDKIGMLEHSYYSVISPEGCASILYKDKTKTEKAAEALKMQTEDLIKLNVIDEIIKEPQGGAHLDPKTAYKNVKSFILNSFDSLKNIKDDNLLNKRYEKFRSMGEFIKN
ncbi:MAG: Acetyl-coenzyme A carboxylase carboxyl transferase subunit alpha [Candidatus Anoxychlamydiales bacterium]|nr:Acetyl-coenzyme A carboxylase carboxyl transferase subunit alpha [Candidatus Anoxychlamydiales bacterium]